MISVDTTFASPSATRPVSDKENNYLIYQEMNKVADMVDNDRFNLLPRPVSGATLTNNMKYVNNNIHNFILLPSFVLSLAS